MKQLWVTICVLGLGLAGIGCDATPKLAPVVLDITDVKPAVDYSRLAEVLNRVVNKDGQVDTFRMNCMNRTNEKYSQLLNSQLKLLAVTGPIATPKLFATPAQRLVYWYNARTAWAIKLGMMQAKSDADKSVSTKDYTYRQLARKFPLDGRLMTLRDIDLLLDDDGDKGFCKVVAVPGILFNRAKLPRKPFDAKTIDKKIHKRVSDFVNSSERFVIDYESQCVLFPPILWKYRDRIIMLYRKTYNSPDIYISLTTAMLNHVAGSARYRLQLAIGYKCVENTRRVKMAIIE